MRKPLLSIALCAAVTLCVSGVALAGLSAPAYDGDDVVYDETNGVFFYPDMNNPGLILKPKAQQQDYIDQLNAAAYAGMTDWRFANFAECYGLSWTFAEYSPDPPDPTDDPPFVAFGIPPEIAGLLPYQNAWVGGDSLARVIPVGRVADEVGNKIQVPDGFNYLFVDGHEADPQVPRPFAVHDPGSDDPTQFLTGIPSEAEYHWAWSEQADGTWRVMFDDDHNYAEDDSVQVYAVFGPFDRWDCSALVVSSTGPLWVDIKPGSDVNPINNNGHGKIPVAILGGRDSYDIGDIDPMTIALEGMGVAIKNNGLPHVSYGDANEDGHRDLLAKIQDVEGAIPEESTMARLTCSLYDGTPLQGADVVNLVPHGGDDDGDEEPAPTLGAYALDQNHPNPFNPTTQIFFTVPAATHVRVEVFDVSGRRLATLTDGSYSEGEHSVLWDAADAPSGVYYYRITTPEFVESRSMVLLK